MAMTDLTSRFWKCRPAVWPRDLAHAGQRRREATAYAGLFGTAGIKCVRQMRSAVRGMYNPDYLCAATRRSPMWTAAEQSETGDSAAPRRYYQSPVSATVIRRLGRRLTGSVG